ncbi:hypothetical protein D3C81_291960 [compost metagenome]
MSLFQHRSHCVGYEGKGDLTLITRTIHTVAGVAGILHCLVNYSVPSRIIVSHGDVAITIFRLERCVRVNLKDLVHWSHPDR